MQELQPKQVFSTNPFADALSDPPSLMEKYAVRFINGQKGCGKTTLLLGDHQKQIPGLAEYYLRQFHMPVLFIDTIIERDEPPDYRSIKIIPWQKAHLVKKGAARIIVNADTVIEFLEHFIEKEISGVLMVYEDPAKYIPQDITNHPIRTVLVDCKNMHNSMALMYHMWTDMPPRMKGLIDQYVIFKNTSDRPQDRGVKNQHVLDAYQRVNDHQVNWYHEIVKQNS